MLPQSFNVFTIVDGDPLPHPIRYGTTVANALAELLMFTNSLGGYFQNLAGDVLDSNFTLALSDHPDNPPYRYVPKLQRK